MLWKLNSGLLICKEIQNNSRIWKLNSGLLKSVEMVKEIGNTITIMKNLATVRGTPPAEILIKILDECKNILKKRGRKLQKREGKTK